MSADPSAGPAGMLGGGGVRVITVEPSPIAAVAAGGVGVLATSPSHGAAGGGNQPAGSFLGDRRVVYECNFVVDAAVAAEFLAYLRAHVGEIVRLEGGALFDRATLCIAEVEGDPHEEEQQQQGQGQRVAEPTAATGEAAGAAPPADAPQTGGPPSPPPPPPGGHGRKTHVCARYRARSRFRLQEYFDRAGERLRRDMREKWGGRFAVQRRILAVHHIVGN